MRRFRRSVSAAIGTFALLAASTNAASASCLPGTGNWLAKGWDNGLPGLQNGGCGWQVLVTGGSANGHTWNVGNISFASCDLLYWRSVGVVGGVLVNSNYRVRLSPGTSDLTILGPGTAFGVGSYAVSNGITSPLFNDALYFC
jgi:hypothetical protein